LIMNGPPDSAKHYFQKAIAKWQVIIAQLPGAADVTPVAYTFCGLAHHHLQEYENAISCFEKAAYGYPDYAEADYALLMMARSIEKMGRRKGLSQEDVDGMCKRVYESLLQRYPGSIHAKVASLRLEHMTH